MLVASKKAESVAKELARANQWASAGLMLGAALELNDREGFERAVNLVVMAQASALDERSKASVEDVREIIREMMAAPSEAEKPGMVARFFNRNRELEPTG